MENRGGLIENDATVRHPSSELKVYMDVPFVWLVVFLGGYDNFSSKFRALLVKLCK